jgi:uncharacterized protein YjbI with pentapeptide repeats
VLWRNGGAGGATIIVKATFGMVNEADARLVAPAEVLREDRYRASHSLEEASETAPYLPSAGVILVGVAHAPPGQPAQALSVRLTVFRDRPLINKTLHVIGYRAPASPANAWPFQDLPIEYERAFGGPGFDDNPVGTGAVPGSRLPNIVDPVDPRRPAGFGPISRRWGSRRRLLGAAGSQGLDQPVPEIPANVDWRYFHAAPADQQTEFLHGDEWIVLDALHPTLPRLQSRLPSVRAVARWSFSSGSAPSWPIELSADTLVINAETQLCSLIWRGHVPLEQADAAARMRVIAGVTLPGYPLAPGLSGEDRPAEVFAPTAAPSGAKRPEIGAPPAPLPLADDESVDANKETRKMAAARHAPPPDDDEPEDPLNRTERIVISKLRKPALPFREAEAGSPPAAAAPRPFSPPPADHPLRRTVEPTRSPFAANPLPFKQADPASPSPFAVPPAAMSEEEEARHGSTISAIHTRSVTLPFVKSAQAPPPPAAPPEPSAPPKPADEGMTRMIDIDALLAKQIAPFALAQPGARNNDEPSVDIPGSPWASGPPVPVETAPPAAPTMVQPPPAMVAPPPTALPVPAMASPEPAMMSPAMASPAPAMMSPAMVSPAPAMVAPPPIMAAASDAPPSPPAMLKAPPADVPPAKPSRPGAAASNPALRDKVVAALAANEALDGQDLSGADLHELDLHGRSLARCKLKGAILTRANLSKAVLSGAQLNEAELGGAVFDGADLAGADLTGASIEGASFKGASMPEVRLAGAHGSGVFDEAQMPKASAEGAQLGKASFKKVSAEGSVWERATLSEASFQGAKLKGANLQRTTCVKTDFAGADLAEAELMRMTGEGVELAGANLDGANLRKVTLVEASFADALMRKAWTDKADLSRCRFTRADLKGTSFRGATLKGAIFAHAQLDGADLRDADLEGANMFGAAKQGAKMTGANTKDLSEADPDRA